MTETAVRTAPILIGGEEIEHSRGGTVESHDPGTGRPIGTVTLADVEHVDQAVDAGRESFEDGRWRGIRPFERGRTLNAIAAALLERRDELAELLVIDSGKPLRDAYWEVDCSARFFEFYGGACDKLHGTSIPLGDGYMDWTVREPIGVSAQIVPWNYPLQVAVRGIAPALAAGCSTVAKPPTEAPLALAELGRLVLGAGLPPGVLNVVPGHGSTVGERLARHPGVDQITFTGSVSVGERVSCAAATHAIPTTMELGGKSPQLLFGDADLDRALPVIAAGMYTHAGQVCNAGTRLLVERSIHDEAVARLHELVRGMRLGHGRDDPDMGPLISPDQRTTVEGYLDLAADEGTVLMGAELPSDPDLRGGNFVRPALVTGLSNGSRTAQEEIFGPVLAVVPFDDLEEAVALANDSEFGLVAGVFTRSIDTAMSAAQALRAGQVWVNAFGVGLDVEFPFGGYKRSGFGREKGLDALAAYLQVKNVCVGFAA